MSLINDMLRDLDARRRAPPDAREALADVRPPPPVPHPRRTVAAVIALVVAAGAALGGAGWYLLERHPAPRVSAAPPGPQATEADPHAAPRPEDGTLPPADRAAAGKAAAASPATPARPMLRAVRLLPGGEGGRTRLVAEIEGPVPPVDTARTADGVLVRLRGARAAAGLAPPSAGPLVKAVEVREGAGALELRARTARPVAQVAVRLLPGAEGAPHRLELQLTPAPRREAPAGAAKTPAAEEPRAATGVARGRGRAGPAQPAAGRETTPPEAGAPAAPVEPPRMERRLRPLTPAQRAERAYAQGLAAMRAGDWAGARRAFRAAMRAVPGHPKSAEALARLELRAGRPQEAERVLREALAAQPGHSALARLLARLLAERGELEAAIATLRRALPGSDAALYGLLGALEQRAGRAAQAAQAYRAALAREPRRAEWWVGLGIALEHLGRGEEAAEAYRRARGLGLAPALERFVGERLAALGR